MRLDRPACIAGPCLVVLTAGLMAPGCAGPAPNPATSKVSRASDADVAPREIASESYHELTARYEEIVELREEVLPAARDAFDGVRNGYRRGLFRNTDVLEAQRTLVELRLREIDAVRAYHVARAALERLTAGGGAQP